MSNGDSRLTEPSTGCAHLYKKNSPTFDDQLDRVHCLTDAVLERTGVGTAVRLYDVPYLDPGLANRDAVSGDQLAVVFAPHDDRLRRRGRLAEQLHGVALFVDEERRRDVAEDWRRCNQQSGECNIL